MAAKQQQLDKSSSLDAMIAHPRVQAWAQLASVYHRVVRELEQALDADGLTLAQFEILVRLHLDGSISQSVLAARLLVTKGNISGLLDRMAKANLVRRQNDRLDRRAHKILLTNHGRKLFASTFPKHIELIHKIMQPLKPSELKALNAAMMRFPASNECRRSVQGK
jgi:DNA-binding MarR family transcriptional regulator